MSAVRHCAAASGAIVVLLGACSSESTQGGGGEKGGARGAPSAILDASNVVIVGRDTIEDGVPITGNLRPIETVEVRARLEGDIIGVYAREGQRVRKGQLLARFENSEQESGQRSAEADRVAAQTELSTAQWNLEQAEELLRAGAIPERDLKTAQQGVATARARLAAANAQLRSTSSFVRDTRVLAPTMESLNPETSKTESMWLAEPTSLPSFEATCSSWPRPCRQGERAPLRPISASASTRMDAP